MEIRILPPLPLFPTHLSLFLLLRLLFSFPQGRSGERAGGQAVGLGHSGYSRLEKKARAANERERESESEEETYAMININKSINNINISSNISNKSNRNSKTGTEKAKRTKKQGKE